MTHRFALALSLGLAACGEHRPAAEAAAGPADPSVPADVAALVASPAAKVVRPGGSIQAAIDAARPGSLVLVAAGTYREALTVSKPLALVGLGAGAVLENPGGADDGVAVTTGPFALVNFTVRDFGVNGVSLHGVNGFLLDRVTAVDNVRYGLFPSHSRRGVIVRCSASGAVDTGIYVGQSSDVLVVASQASNNVSGIEIENSTRVAVLGNDATANSLGIFVDLLPGLDVKTGSDILVRGNRVRDNNRPNDATEGLAVVIPQGMGILVLGDDRVSVQGNRVTGNDTVGIALVSTSVLYSLGAPPDPAIDPDPDDVRVTGNVILGNGTAPAPTDPFPGADLLWDGSGAGNCFGANLHGTSFPDPLPACAPRDH